MAVQRGGGAAWGRARGCSTGAWPNRPTNNVQLMRQWAACMRQWVLPAELHLLPSFGQCAAGEPLKASHPSVRYSSIHSHQTSCGQRSMDMERVEPPTLDELGPAVAQLELENAFLAHLLQRVSGGSARTGAAAAATDDGVADQIGREPLLLAERQELCAVEAGAVRREIQAATAAGELERACAVAAAADCRTYQAAEVGRAVAALLGLLGLPQPDTATAAAMAAASAAAAAAAAAEQPAAAGQAPEQPSSTRSASSPPGPRSPTTAACLPTAKRLARAQVDGRQIAQLLEELLERQDVAAERLRVRAAMLQVRCAVGW